MTTIELELTALGRELHVAEPPDLVPAVLARIEAQQREPLRPASRRLALAVAMVLVAILAATFAIPDARSALLRILHIGGERIEVVEKLPPIPPGSEDVDLDSLLGRRVTLEEARQDAGFPLRELEQAPDRVYLGQRGTVWFLYGKPDDVRLLVAQTPELQFGNEVLLKKIAGPETQIEHVLVDGAPGVYITGAPHAVLLVDDRGRIVEESLRLANDVLVWEDGGVSYRLEGEFPVERALEIATSMR